MNLYKFSFGICCFLLLLAAAPASAQINTADVVFIPTNIAVPAYCKPMGKVSVTDGGLKLNCGYEKVLQDARIKTVQAGGNVMKVTKLKSPSALGSSCYQIWGEAYYTDSLDAVRLLAEGRDTVSNKLISDTASYALLYIYRPRGGTGFLLNYVVHLDDAEVCSAGSNSKCIVKVDKEGMAKLWATIETRCELPLDIQFGKVYFIKCEIGMGVWAGRPQLSIIKPNKGYAEFLKIRD